MCGGGFEWNSGKKKDPRSSGGLFSKSKAATTSVEASGLCQFRSRCHFHPCLNCPRCRCRWNLSRSCWSQLNRCWSLCRCCRWMMGSPCCRCCQRCPSRYPAQWSSCRSLSRCFCFYAFCACQTAFVTTMSCPGRTTRRCPAKRMIQNRSPAKLTIVRMSSRCSNLAPRRHLVRTRTHSTL